MYHWVEINSTYNFSDRKQLAYRALHFFHSFFAYLFLTPNSTDKIKRMNDLFKNDTFCSLELN